MKVRDQRQDKRKSITLFRAFKTLINSGAVDKVMKEVIEDLMIRVMMNIEKNKQLENT